MESQPRPSRRTFSEPPARKGLRDTDLGQRGVMAYVVFAAIPGAALGAALGYFLVAKQMAPMAVAALCPLLGAAFTSGLTLFVTNKGGDAAATLYNPSGKSTPRKKEHSYAESLVARGEYAEAVTAYELAVAEDPSDPIPYLSIARIYRNQLGQMEDAARWFRRALRESAAPPGLQVLARKELVELYTHRMGTPERALPELARMAEEMAGTDEGAWAARELAELKRRLAGGAEE